MSSSNKIDCRYTQTKSGDVWKWSGALLIKINNFPFQIKFVFWLLLGKPCVLYSPNSWYVYAEGNSPVATTMLNGSAASLKFLISVFFLAISLYTLSFLFRMSLIDVDSSYFSLFFAYSVNIDFNGLLLIVCWLHEDEWTW